MRTPLCYWVPFYDEWRPGIKLEISVYLYPWMCTFLTALPEGSLRFWNDASQASASGVLQATDFTEGTVVAAESDGKCSVKIER